MKVILGILLLALGLTVNSQSEDRFNMEKIAQQLKLQGLLKEQDDGLIAIVEGAGYEEDQARLEAVCSTLNQHRQQFYNKQPGLEATYSRRISDADEREVKTRTGKVLIRIGCPLSLGETLVPELVKSYLENEHGSQNPGVMHWNGARHYYATLANSTAACIIVRTCAPQDLKEGLEANNLDCGIDYTTSGEDTSSDDTIGLDGLAIIVNPLSLINVCPDSSVAALENRTWLRVKDESECTIPALTHSRVNFKTVRDFNEADDLVFSNQGYVAVVPLGVASFTNNKLIRISTNRFTAGYYPTQLTVNRRNYPWIRPIIVKRGNSECSEFKSFSRFLDGSTAKAIVLKSGYATE